MPGLTSVPLPGLHGSKSLVLNPGLLPFVQVIGHQPYPCYHGKQTSGAPPIGQDQTHEHKCVYYPSNLKEFQVDSCLHHVITLFDNKQLPSFTGLSLFDFQSFGQLVIVMMQALSVKFHFNQFYTNSQYMHIKEN